MTWDVRYLLGEQSASCAVFSPPPSDGVTYDEVSLILSRRAFICSTLALHLHDLHIANRMKVEVL